MDDFGYRNCTLYGQEYASGTFTVYAGPSGSIATVGSTTSHSLTVAANPAWRGKTISWYVVTTNSLGRTATSSTWSFQFPTTIQAKAVEVRSPTASCTDVVGSTTNLDGTTFTTSPQLSPVSQTQSGGSFVSWSLTNPAPSYTITGTPPDASFFLANACFTKTGAAPYSQGLGASIGPGDSLTWYLGYVRGTPWVQVGGGGSVYAATTITSRVPSGASPQAFALAGAGGTPGMVTYGTDYDFSLDSQTRGASLVSQTSWLAQDTHAPPTVDYYDLLWRRLGGGTTPATAAEMGSDQSALAKPPSRAKPYYIVGDAATEGDWVVGDGETIILIVNGNLTINGAVTTQGTGFVAFLVKGTITVSPAVGVPYTSSDPVLMGVYVTSPQGAFDTGGSSVPGRERFVGKGTFVAGSFLLRRDLSSVSANTTTAAELFLWDPTLLMKMPEAMKKHPVFWQEVAP